MEKKRLASLDILRGFDLWLLVFFCAIAHSFSDLTSGPFWDLLADQTEHPAWGNHFVMYDIIMPLFIFMSGITIPFSMSRYHDGEKPGREFWWRIIRRFCLLFFIGWIVQGNLLTWEWHQWHPFANTLQSIAVAYVAAAIAYVYGGVRWQVIVSAVCFVVYFLCFAVNGQMNPDIQNNVAMWVDEAILGSHRDGVIWADDGTWTYDANYRYTWILSSLDFIVTGIMGCLVGHVLKNSTKTPSRRALQIAIAAVVLIIAGLVMDQFFPINKKIWNSSMTLYSGGICAMMMAFTYYIVDVRGWSRGLNWLKIYGMNSIVAYFLGEAVNFTSVSNSLLYGFEHLTGEYYPVVIATGNACILFLILLLLYKTKIFLKV